MSRPSRSSYELEDLVVPAGRTGRGALPLPRLVTGSAAELPIQVLHGRQDGPTVFVSAAVHGDEIAGIESIRRVAERLDARRLHGTVLLVPVVNVHGFATGDRYLPDRRDLNRSFPGSAGGSLASRIARLFMDSVVARCDVGIDLHTGSDHRANLPQVRGDLDDARTLELATAFAPPLLLHARVRDGSLREAGTSAGVTMLLYEGGEALRYDEVVVATATTGVLRVLAHLGMIPDDEPPPPATAPPAVSRSSRWVRARRSGIAPLSVDLGDRVAKGDTLAVVRDTHGKRLSTPASPVDGVVIGANRHPLVHQGDALVHVAEVAAPDQPRDGQQLDHQSFHDTATEVR